MELLLKRTYQAGGTNGMLYYNDSFLCYTIELPWHDNAPQHSCIPEGRYQLKFRHSKKFSLHLQVCGVRNRSLILIHPANDALTELKGCIAPVMMLTGQGKGSSFKMALEKLKE